jgi:ABC-type transport system involved in multi-copper enzyme maturation permease subunit
MGREGRAYAIFGLGFGLVLEAMLVAAVLWWPAFHEHAGALKGFLSKIPVRGDIVELADRTGVKGYVFGQHFFKGCNTMGSAAAILFAMGAVAGEAFRGTMEIWLARPVSRLRLLGERFVYGLAALWIPIIVSSLTIPWLLTFVDESMSFSALWGCILHQCLFLGSLYSVTFLLSAVGSQPVAIAFGMLLFVSFQFSIYLVKTITHWSFYRLADLDVLLAISGTRGLVWLHEAALLGVHLLCFGAAYWAFRRRVP